MYLDWLYLARPVRDVQLVTNQWTRLVEAGVSSIQRWVTLSRDRDNYVLTGFSRLFYLSQKPVRLCVCLPRHATKTFVLGCMSSYHNGSLDVDVIPHRLKKNH